MRKVLGVRSHVLLSWQVDHGAHCYENASDGRQHRELLSSDGIDHRGCVELQASVSTCVMFSTLMHFCKLLVVWCGGVAGS